MYRPLRLLCAALAFLALAANAFGQFAESGAAKPHEQLDSALWVQSSAEFFANASQTFAAATEKLALALRDPTWTASIEQYDEGGYEKLPPAVIVNVDETVLNNSPYQARIIQEYGQHDIERFLEWCNEAQCPAVPGAKKFLDAAKKQGVAIIYISPRPEITRDATLRNLTRHDFPFEVGKDQLMLAGAWPNHDKRERVGNDFRILLIVSDNLGDFLQGTDESAKTRRDVAERCADYWGLKWFILPNPMYGHWEYSFHDYDYGLNRPARIENKLQALDPAHAKP